LNQNRFFVLEPTTRGKEPEGMSLRNRSESLGAKMLEYSHCVQDEMENFSSQEGEEGLGSKAKLGWGGWFVLRPIVVCSFWFAFLVLFGCFGRS
jgi:hypothetical protein